MATLLWWGAEASAVRAIRWAVPAVLGPALLLLLVVKPPFTRGHGELARRIDGFQRSFLYQLARTPGVLEADTWRGRLERHRGEVERSLCRGLGRGSRRRRRRTAALLEDAWEQIVAVMEQRAGGGAAQPLAGIGIEMLIRHALAGALGTAPSTGYRGQEAGGALPVAAREWGPEVAAGQEASEEGASVALAEAATAGPAATDAQRGGAPAAESSRPAEPSPTPAPAVYEAAAFAEAVAAARRSVALEGGVYRIRKELYGSRPAARASLRQMAEGVLTDDKLERLVAAGRRQECRIPVAAQGLRYDQLLAQYADSRAPAIRARALEERRRSLDAAGAAVLVQEEDGYRMTLAVGCLAPLAGTFALAAGSALYDDCLEGRRYLVLDAPAAGRAWYRYAAGLAAVEAGASGRLALLPAILDATPAYLLFTGSAPPADGRTGGDWDLDTLISCLNLHP